MIIKYLTFCTILLGFFSCQNNPMQETFVIEGQVAPNTIGKVFLYEFKNREYIPIDSVEVKNNSFRFEGSVKNPILYSLQLNKIGKRANFFIENSQISMKINSEWQIETINGGKNTLLFRKYDLVNQKKAINIDSILKIDNNSPVIAYFLGRNAYLYDYEDLVLFQNQLSEELRSNIYVEELDRAIERLSKIQVGQPAPEIIMEDINGNPLKLSDLRGKNVLIDFWASWCSDCRKENPHLVKIYEAYKDKNFTILGISLDRNKDDWKQAIIKDGLTWQQGFVEGAWKSEAAQTYVIRWLPTSLLINENGIIIARNIDNQKLISDIEKLIYKN